MNKKPMTRKRKVMSDKVAKVYVATIGGPLMTKSFKVINEVVSQGAGMHEIDDDRIEFQRIRGMVGKLSSSVYNLYSTFYKQHVSWISYMRQGAEMMRLQCVELSTRKEALTDDHVKRIQNHMQACINGTAIDLKTIHEIMHKCVSLSAALAKESVGSKDAKHASSIALGIAAAISDVKARRIHADNRKKTIEDICDLRCLTLLVHHNLNKFAETRCLAEKKDTSV